MTALLTHYTAGDMQSAALSQQRTAGMAAEEQSVCLLQGRVVEEGSPQELLARGGRYAELWARQASLDDVAAHDAPPRAEGAASDGDDKEQVRCRV
jgi:hypothetical protein